MNKTYAYIIVDETNNIYLPPPSLAGDIGSPISWALQGRSLLFKNHFSTYTVSIVSSELWHQLCQSHTVQTIESNDMKR